MKVALVHDWLVHFGGAERVLLALRDIFPDAPIYTFLYDQEKMGRFFSNAEIRPSFLQKAPSFLKNNHKYFLPIMPVVPETFDLSEFDLVISSSSAFAKGIITRPRTIHICYCHSPMRFIWDWREEYLKEQFNSDEEWYWPAKISEKMFTRLASQLMVHYLRMWDRSSVGRVDYFVANSRVTQERIKKYYGCESELIYPPVAMSSINESLNVNSIGSYFLIVSRLASYKRIDLAIKAFNKLELPLVIVGDGPDRKRLEKMAGSTIRFLGFRSNEAISRLHRNSVAFVSSGEEDFGIAPVEAMSYGKPVIAFRKGGLSESVVEGMTGEFFDDPYPEVLAYGVRRLLDNYENYSPIIIRKRAEKFSEEVFKKEIEYFIWRVLNGQTAVKYKF